MIDNEQKLLTPFLDVLWLVGVDPIECTIERDNGGDKVVSVEIEQGEYAQLVTFAYHANKPLLNYLSGLNPDFLFEAGGYTDSEGYWRDSRTITFSVGVHVPVNELGLIEALLSRDPDSQPGNSMAA
ncbi:hypothetical protein N9S00_08120 [Luminiphilus sp.]|nr:hypothetical protein [Luminiphilus sp.]